MIKCAYCGKKNKDGATYCKRCGIGLPVSAPEEAEVKSAPEVVPPPGAMQVPPPPGAERFDWTVSLEKTKAKAKQKKKSLLITLMLIAALLVGALVIWYFAATRGEILPSRSGYTALEGAAVHKGELIMPEGEQIVACETSLKGATLGMLAESGKLYCYCKGQESLVASYVTRFICSADGAHFIYTDENGLLWSSDCTHPENAPVCICNEPVSEFVVSPDGESVLFNKQGNADLFMYSNKKITLAAVSQEPVSVSNGGRYIYGFSTEDSALYFTDRRGRSAFVRSNIIGGIYLNSGHNEIVFSTDSGDGKVITMICSNGSEPKQIINASGAVEPVFTVSGRRLSVSPAGRTVVTCPFKSFENRLFAGAGLAVNTRSGAEVLEPNDCTFAAATDDYCTVYYITNGSVVKRSVNGSAEAVKICDAASFRISANGSKLWFTDGTGALWYYSSKISEPVIKGVEDYVVRPNNGAALFLRNGTVSRNSDGKVQNSYAFEFDKPVTAIAADSFGLYGKTEDGWVKLNSGGNKVGWYD